MKYKNKSSKWLVRQIGKIQDELNSRKRAIPFPNPCPVEKRDFSWLALAVQTFINRIWNDHPDAFSEESFREIFIAALRAYYGFDIWKKITCYMKANDCDKKLDL